MDRLDADSPELHINNILKRRKYLKRLGLFGGTFDPIHLGHIQVAEEVKKKFSLDEILFIPSALPPHKEPGYVADARDRLEMIKLALSGYADFTVSDVELKRPGPSYTIDTVLYFKSILNDKTSLYLIMGLDAILEIDTWKSYLDLFLLVPFIVLTRTLAGRNDTDDGWRTLEKYLKSMVSDGYRFSALQSCFIHNEKQPVFVFDIAPIDISSTHIRRCIKKGKAIEFLVPNIVQDFIEVKGLYL
jgi:nicotinate-nucleotide adenylyltransferase